MNKIYTEFKQKQSTQDLYQTRLPWKTDYHNLHNNKNQILTCLSNLIFKLQRDSALFKEHDDKIKE